jgi:Zn-dependent protease with chaperone function
MNFFEHQDAARRSTTRLVMLFALAVLAIVVSIELLLAATMGYVTRHPDTGAVNWAAVADPSLMMIALFGTLGIVGAGSAYKTAQLRAGGRVVAEQLAGRLLSPDTQDPIERRLLNVVEEMAIASGTPAPPVYLMDAEDGINAFAAGFSPDDAVIGVTRGTATRLTRDELQGVIAHEFSHILNGDMRLNIRLIGLLHGILIIGMLGYFVLRSSFYSGAMGRGRRGRDNSALPILAIGAGLAVIGFAGTFFGNLIKAAVSRQREFLADASAVQFTRQPDGIAGALKKIGGFSAGSSVRHPNAPEASHMFFGRATSGLSAMFSTHPPLAERIRRIDPSWDGELPAAVPAIGADEDVRAGRPLGVAAFAGSPRRASETDVRQAVAQAGQPTPKHLAYAARLIETLPDSLISAAREPYGARAVVYALLLDRRDDMRAQQLARLDAEADPAVFEETRRLWPHVASLDHRHRLPLVEIALPALRALTSAQSERFRRNVVALVEADSAIDLFEWALYRILLRDLQAHERPARTARVQHASFDAVQPAAASLLSTLAYVGQRDDARAAAAFARGVEALGRADLRLLPRQTAGLRALDESLGVLDTAAPDVKRRVLDGAAACIAADGEVTAGEAEILRAVSATIGVPMPPVLAS